MAAKEKATLDRKVRYLFTITDTLNEELKQEAIEALAVGGIAVVRRQVAAALETTRAGLSTSNPGPDGVRPWLEGFMGSVRAAVADELANLLSGQNHLLNPYSEREFMDALNEGLSTLVVKLTGCKPIL